MKCRFCEQVPQKASELALQAS